MTKTVRARFVDQASAQFFFIWMIIAHFALSLSAQEIRIRVLNGRNGKPVTKECLNVWIGPVRGVALFAPTNNEGIAVIHIRDIEATADDVSSSACRANSVGPRSIPKDSDTIAVVGSEYVACQEYAKPAPGEPPDPDLFGKLMPSYSIKRILELGVSSANTCGKIRAQARPGELVLFVRPMSRWERLKS
jgi:hypothetical protein